MDRHRSFLETICRICAEVIASACKYNVRGVADIIEDVYEDQDGSDIKKDHPETESTFLCQRCYKNLKKWNDQHQKFLKYKKKNPHSDKVFTSTVKLPPSIEHPWVHLGAECPCSADHVSDEDDNAAGQEDGEEDQLGGADDNTGPLDDSTADDNTGPLDDSTNQAQEQDVLGEDGCTPSKLLKLSLTPIESPSDKLSERQKRSNIQAKRSIKFSYSKAVVDEISGEVTFAEDQVKKVFTAPDSFEPDRVENAAVAKFYFCQICGNFPINGMVNIKCMHFYCTQCIGNLQETIPTSQCPASDEDGQKCRHPTTDLYKMSGFLSKIHDSLGIACKNVHCEEYLKLSEIDEHQLQCKKKGSYKRQAESISKSRSKPLHKKVSEELDALMKWCEKQKVSACDFLFFALGKKIRDEAPALEESIQDIFKVFLEGKDVEKFTPMMGLALKLDINLSHRQYVKLSAKKVFGKLPDISKVRRAADQLDPGNVHYQVVSKSTGEMIREHVAVVKSGIIDVDHDLGHLSFGDLNPNIHGFRATLCDSVAKQFEELYPDIAKALVNNEVANEDNARKFKLFTKVAFDGTSAPVKSDKGASRLPVSNWLRGTLCLVAVQVSLTTF